VSFPDTNQPFVKDAVEMPDGIIPRVSSDLSLTDRIGSFKARWGIGRMSFTVDPGLYALGSPDRHSPVFVTANYKMSFDRLRNDLKNRDSWLLVLNTQGINVWCAAGKGSFGTDELSERIHTSGLSRIISHKDLILPQLSAPGVSAHVVHKNTGFNVRFGPVRSSDLPAFIDSGYKATPEMRLKNFPIMDRAALIPMELIIAMKWMLIIFPFVFMLSGLFGSGPFLSAAIRHGFFAAVMLTGGMTAGTIIAPLLLPWLPGRAFAMKGFSAAVIVLLPLLGLFSATSYPFPAFAEAFSLFLISSGVAMFLAMNFTGSSTFTSSSGVRKEMKWAVPIQIGCGIIGFGMWVWTLYAA
jgi:acetyl-CoA decarbonylase/synthase complex subunit gamma